ncbi:HlyD family secretion protein [Pseudothauera hydrothermalis]|jgi:HlyD family secretion protein|uniref:HlyD family secretion protein n=1 Tax=Pseudothauera hydrothermalis TaxID=2184083 RepID=UPI000C7AB267|nr:HlyD family efflux transporter periplasmic adaptor subunit [Pseudothauera hydrothermalis]AUM00327.1 efflux transporter periplasmic adaptor subunit [Rhodocyclaceae bacterium]
MNRSRLKRISIFALLALCAAIGGFYLYPQRQSALPPGIAAGNGRLEATEVDVATKIAGRLAELAPREGDWVEAGAVVGRLDADDLRAQLRAAEAQAVQAQKAAEGARADVRKLRSDVSLAEKTLKRSEELIGKGFVSRNKLDTDQSGMERAVAGMAQAQSRVAEADAAVAAALAKVDSLKATLNDTLLKAPIAGRVLYRLAEPGEVLAAGGKVLTLVDLSDMYMTVYLPTEKAGQVAIQSEARIVLDALPGQAIPAKVGFVAAKAQFTPREVETRTEREKLMFRLKVQADPAWLAAHRDLAKGGMPGVAYVKLDANAVWPANLQIEEK